MLTRDMRALVCLALVLIACGDDADDTTADARVAIDAALLADAPLSAVDALASPDAALPDATSTTDANQTADANGATADAAAIAGGDTCAMATDVTAGGTFANQTTVGAADDYGPPLGGGCPSGGAASGNDVVYSVAPSTTTTYEVTVVPDGAGFDPMLYAVSACDFSNGCIAGTVLNGAGQQEQITFSAPGGQTTYIVVDGEVVSSGGFTLTVAIP